jgi:hypothetical protein
MTEVKTYIKSLFSAKGIEISPNRQTLFDDFVNTLESKDAVKNIIETQNKLMDNWKIKNRISEKITLKSNKKFYRYYGQYITDSDEYINKLFKSVLCEF